MLNLYDLTGGNYRVRRTITYPDFPESELVMEAEVRAVGDQDWSTTMTIDGTYTGPTDFVSMEDYRLVWTLDGQQIAESGSATLMTSSGESILSVWTTTITPTHGISDFPEGGEDVTLVISPFELDGNTMTYRWQGTVTARSER